MYWLVFCIVDVETVEANKKIICKIHNIKQCFHRSRAAHRESIYDTTMNCYNMKTILYGKQMRNTTYE